MESPHSTTTSKTSLMISCSFFSSTAWLRVSLYASQFDLSVKCHSFTVRHLAFSIHGLTASAKGSDSVTELGFAVIAIVVSTIRQQRVAEPVGATAWPS